ncbi:hypothetical protein CSUI_000231 [Cystoisospora suis]|uniref:Uncharacterized protein n=1 Tax=Cystoisospora suis TaxID=483139 RepID=A0A2C6LI24_9APIC|nr:hypothetical protein CSUI_000231 [Cystoisospora suis]
MYPRTRYAQVGAYTASYSTAAQAITGVYPGQVQAGVPALTGVATAPAVPGATTIVPATAGTPSVNQVPSNAPIAPTIPSGSAPATAEGPGSAGGAVRCTDPSLGELLVIANKLKSKNISTRDEALQSLRSEKEYLGCDESFLASIIDDPVVQGVISGQVAPESASRGQCPVLTQQDVARLADYLASSTSNRTEDAIWRKIRGIPQLNSCTDEEIYVLSHQGAIKRLYDSSGSVAARQEGSSGQQTGPSQPGSSEWCRLQPAHPLCSQ